MDARALLQLANPDAARGFRRRMMPAARLAALSALGLTVACATGTTKANDVDASVGSDAGVDGDAGMPFDVTELKPPPEGWEGRIFRYRFGSPVEGIASREVKVLVPPGYSDPQNAARTYPSFYLHDGQNCLDHDPFGHGGWRVHTISYSLVEQGLMAPVILVMIDNGGSARSAEYFPGTGTAPGPTAEGFLRFVEEAVVPWVDAHFRTSGAIQRGMGGSSYGAVISLYAAWRRPDLWSVVMAMSPAFIAADPSKPNFNFEASVTEKKPVRIYLDSGTVDWSGGDDGAARTTALADLLASRGWVLHEDLEHVVAQGHNHSEDFWRKRLAPSTPADAPNSWPGALPFLYPP